MRLIAFALWRQSLDSRVIWPQLERREDLPQEPAAGNARSLIILLLVQRPALVKTNLCPIVLPSVDPATTSRNRSRQSDPHHPPLLCILPSVHLPASPPPPPGRSSVCPDPVIELSSSATGADSQSFRERAASDSLSLKSISSKWRNSIQSASPDPVESWLSRHDEPSVKHMAVCLSATIVLHPDLCLPSSSVRTALSCRRVSSCCQAGEQCTCWTGKSVHILILEI